MKCTFFLVILCLVASIAPSKTAIQYQEQSFEIKMDDAGSRMLYVYLKPLSHKDAKTFCEKSKFGSKINKTPMTLVKTTTQDEITKIWKAFNTQTNFQHLIEEPYWVSNDAQVDGNGTLEARKSDECVKLFMSKLSFAGLCDVPNAFICEFLNI